MPKLRIVSAAVSKTGVTIYLEDGSHRELSSTDFRTHDLLDKITPILARGSAVAEIELNNFTAAEVVEARSGGFLKLAWRKVKGYFSTPDKPALDDTSLPPLPMRPAPEAKTVEALIADETLVATIGDKEIPGLEQIAAQIEHAAETGNQKGLERFLERIAAVIDKRGHETQELLSFMKRGDLPIAEDGTIVAYKRLYRERDGRFTDPHTRKVSQAVGSRVSMDEKLVDPSRRTECSTGLHIGRRDYMPSFNGDTICLVKVAPEDVIAVPRGEPSKMRVAAYHIVGELPDDAFKLIAGRGKLDDSPEGALMLARVLAGDHIGIMDEVVIGAEKGGDLKIVPAANAPEAPKPRTDIAPAKTLVEKQIERTTTEAVDPKAVRAKIEAERLAAVAESGDLGAALDTPEEATSQPSTPTSAPEKPKRAKKVKAEKIDKPKPAAPANDDEVLTPEKKRALELHREGKLSQRAIERETGVPVRTLKRLLAKGH